MNASHIQFLTRATFAALIRGIAARYAVAVSLLIVLPSCTIPGLDLEIFEQSSPGATIPDSPIPDSLSGSVAPGSTGRSASDPGRLTPHDNVAGAAAGRSDSLTDTGTNPPQSPAIPALERIAGVLSTPRKSPQRTASTVFLRSIPLPGEVFLSGHTDGTIRISELNSGRSGEMLRVAPAEQMAVTADLRYVAIAGGAGVIIYALSSGEEVAALRYLQARVVALDFFSEGESVLLGGADGRVYRWRFLLDPATAPIGRRNQGVERYIGHASVVSAVESHPAGRIFFSGDWSGVMSAWLAYDADPHQGKFDRDIFGGRFFGGETARTVGRAASGEQVDHLVVSPDGQTLIVALSPGVVEVRDVRGLRLLATVPAHAGLVYSVAFAEDGRSFATVGRDGFVRTWRIERPDDPVRPVSIVRVGEVALAGARVVAIGDGKTAVGMSDGRVSDAGI